MHEARLLACVVARNSALHHRQHVVCVETTCQLHLRLRRVGVKTPCSFFSVGGRPPYASLLIFRLSTGGFPRSGTLLMPARVDGSPEVAHRGGGRRQPRPAGSQAAHPLPEWWRASMGLSTSGPQSPSRYRVWWRRHRWCRARLPGLLLCDLSVVGHWVWWGGGRPGCQRLWLSA